MAEDHRLLEPYRTEAAVVVVMQVRSADAANGELDLDLAGAGLFRLALFDAQVLRGVNDDGFHVWPHRTGVRSGRPAKWALRLSKTSLPIALRVS